MVKTYDPATITILNTSSSAAKALAVLSQNQGYFKQFNLNESIDALADGNRVTAGIISGAADLAIFTGPSPVFSAGDQNAPLRIVSGALNKPYYYVYSAMPGIKTLKDLEGKSIGTGAPGALLHVIMMTILKSNGVDTGKVQFINIGSSVDIYKAVVAKKVDAGPSTISFKPRMDQDGVTTIADVWKLMPNFVNTVFFTNADTISKKRDPLIRTLAALGQGIREIRRPDSEAEYVKAYEQIGATADEAKFERAWFRENDALAWDLVVTPEQINFTQQVNVDAGNQKGILPFEKVADMSLAQEALKIMTVK